MDSRATRSPLYWIAGKSFGDVTKEVTRLLLAHNDRPCKHSVITIT